MPSPSWHALAAGAKGVVPRAEGVGVADVMSKARLHIGT